MTTAKQRWDESQARIRQPGSAILTNWMAQREAGRIQNAGIPLSSGVRGSELYDWFANGVSSAGTVVNEKTALYVSAVYSCVGLIGGAIASLPFHIYLNSPDGRERIDHDLWWLFNESPYGNWTAAAFWEYVAQSRLFHGDAFARIHRASPMSPKIVGFEPIHPLRVVVEKIDGLLHYTIFDAITNKATTLDQGDMLHIPGQGFDGIRSISALRHALRTSAGTALAADEYSSRFFSNGARPDFVLSTDGKLDQAQLDMLRTNWDAVHSGANRSHRPAILQGGLKVQEITMTSEDAQLLATRQFQVEDIARIFGVPPHMIGHTEKATSWGSGVEQMSIGFVKYTLQRHLRQIEQEINRKVWPRSLRYFAEFNTAGLERGDLKTRYDAYRIALGRAGEPGFMTVNEARKIENLKPIAGGDQLSQATDPTTSDPQPNPANEALTVMAGSISALAMREPPQQQAQVLNIPAPIVNVQNGATRAEISELMDLMTKEIKDMPIIVNVPEQAAPIVHITNQAPEQAAPVVNVTNQIPEQPTPLVHVVNEVSTPEVNVNLPARKIEGTIERDKAGNIIKTTQIETDL